MKVGLLIALFLTSINSFGTTAQCDKSPLPDVRATTYYIADEEKTSCRGRYAGRYYNGDERAEVLTPSGRVLAVVCKRFFRVLAMEGTGILKDRGKGRFTVNWAGNYRFKKMTKCVHGEGVASLCLIPYHTIAADLKSHPRNSVVYIPKAKGLIKPNGDVHNGYFLVRDTGGAFRDIGLSRIDLFVGDENDRDNIFSRAGISHLKGEKAFRVTGKLKDEVVEEFKQKYPNLF